MSNDHDATAAATEAVTVLLDDLPEPLRSVLGAAIEQRASDVHVDPVEGGEIVRFRVDGVVHQYARLTVVEGDRLVNQAKVAAELRPDRLPTPEEGLLSLQAAEVAYDMRVTAVPVMEEEAVHLRFMSAEWEDRGFGELGLGDEQASLIRDVLMRGRGLVLISGATGGGKTTTLYALAREIDLDFHVATSIEDPVEFRVPGLRQVQVNRVQGLTMADGLRVLLRMDPNVLILGEVRDQDSAMIAARAALTGGLVMATVHAPDAPTAVLALQHMSVPRYVLGGALRVVITQDLLPRLCPECRRTLEVSAARRDLFGRFDLEVPAELFAACDGGCDACNGYGHTGQIGIFEISSVDRHCGYRIAEGLSRQDMDELLTPAADQCLSADALRKAAAGVVGIADAERLVASRGD